MAQLKITKARRYLAALKHSKSKFETRETLSQDLGYYPDVISEDLAFLDPMVRLDYDYNLLLLIPALEAYVEKLSKERKKSVPERVKKKDTDEYEGVGDFVYKEMTIGKSGIINRNANLSDKKLRILIRLINMELKRRKDE